MHVVRRFHYEVDALGLRGEPHVLEGRAAPSKVRDSGLPESDQASGTAVVIRPGSYPPGVKDGFTAAQRMVIRDILADTEGVVRWGGDGRRPYEGLFCLAVPPGELLVLMLVGLLVALIGGAAVAAVVGLGVWTRARLRRRRGVS